MSISLGVLFALGALIFWGLGDFLIQRSTRKIGNWETLFIITLFGTVILIPFIYKDLLILFSFQDKSFLILLAVSIILLVASLFDFEALKKGKLVVIEPLLALEVPIASIFAFLIIEETIELIQVIIITFLIIGIILVSIKSHHIKRKKWIEKGVLLAVIGAIFMGASNFFVGFASRITSPLLTNWFISFSIAAVCCFYLIYKKRLKKTINLFKKHKSLITSVSISDNIAWICFAFATVFAPIAIVTAFSESYIILAVLLGRVINKEHLMKHQKIGLFLAISSAIILATTIR